MKLKRQYDKKTLKSKRPTILYVDVQNGGKEWRPSGRIINRGAAEGWLSIVDGVITLKTHPDLDDVKYRIMAPPGYYCCFDGEPLPDEKAAKRYVETHFKGKTSPSANYPAGYARHHFYITERIDA